METRKEDQEKVEEEEETPKMEGENSETKEGKQLKEETPGEQLEVDDLEDVGKTGKSDSRVETKENEEVVIQKEELEKKVEVEVNVGEKVNLTMVEDKKTKESNEKEKKIAVKVEKRRKVWTQFVKQIISKVIEYIEDQKDFFGLFCASKAVVEIVEKNPECSINVVFKICAVREQTELVFKHISEKKKIVTREMIHSALDQIKYDDDGSGNNVPTIYKVNELLGSMMKSFGRKKVHCYFQKPLTYVHRLIVEKNIYINETVNDIFTNLRAVQMRYFNLRNYSSLKFQFSKVFGGIKELILFSNYVESKYPISIRDVEWVKFRNLENLEFYSVTTIRDELLNYVPKSLRSLKVVGPPKKFQKFAPMLIRFMFLKNLKENLRKLEVMNCHYLKDIYITEMKNLESVVLVSCDRFKGLFLKNLKKMKKLVLFKMNNLSKNALKGLERVSPLNFLHIWECPNFKKIDVKMFMKRKFENELTKFLERELLEGKKVSKSDDYLALSMKLRKLQVYFEKKRVGKAPSVLKRILQNAKKQVESDMSDSKGTIVVIEKLRPFFQ